MTIFIVVFLVLENNFTTFSQAQKSQNFTQSDFSALLWLAFYLHLIKGLNQILFLPSLNRMVQWLIIKRQIIKLQPFQAVCCLYTWYCVSVCVCNQPIFYQDCVTTFIVIRCRQTESDGTKLAILEQRLPGPLAEYLYSFKHSIVSKLSLL